MAHGIVYLLQIVQISFHQVKPGTSLSEVLNSIHQVIFKRKTIGQTGHGIPGNQHILMGSINQYQGDHHPTLHGRQSRRQDKLNSCQNNNRHREESRHRQASFIHRQKRFFSGYQRRIGAQHGKAVIHQEREDMQGTPLIGSALINGKGPACDRGGNDYQNIQNHGNRQIVLNLMQLRLGREHIQGIKKPQIPNERSDG